MGAVGQQAVQRGSGEILPTHGDGEQNSETGGQNGRHLFGRKNRPKPDHRHRRDGDGKKVDIRSFKVKSGMTISIREKSQTMKGLKESVENSSRAVPEYLSLDEKKFSGQLLSTPEADQIVLTLPINIALVCEFLANTH